MIERKGHRFLLEAVQALRDRAPPFRVVLFGEGELDGELREQAERLGISDIVQFAGFRDDLDAYFGCIDLFVHPALSEGLGVATLKAAAAGVPVAGFAAGGLVEAVLDGQTGLLVAPGDGEALTATIARLLDDEALRRRLGAAGRERMQDEFSINTMVNGHVALYESILNG